MKICLVINMHRTFTGVSLQAHLLARALIDAGHEARLVCFDRMEEGETAPCLGEPFSLHKRYQLEYERIPFTPEAISAFFQKTRGQYEIVHFFGTYNIHPQVAALLKSFHIPVIYRPARLRLDDPLTIAESREGRQHLRNIHHSIDALIGISEPIYQSLLSSPLGQDKSLSTVKLVNAVDTDFFAPVKDKEKRKRLKKKLGFPPQTSLVVFVGRFEPEKGADILINCWPMVRRACPEAQLAIIGSVCTLCRKVSACDDFKETSEANRLLTHKFSPLLEMQAGIKFMENRGNVEQYLQVADLFLFPSRQEGMPNALLEAMACALACVTSGIKEITDDIITSAQTGRAIESEDPHEYARAIIQLLNNPEERREMGKKARQRMVEHFSLSKNLERHLDLYEKLLK
ncbi:MAG: glycosyltransferase family 4 protein [bacterium]